MPFTVSAAEKPELLTVYAALILADDKIAVTADNITKLIKAAGADVEPYWPKLFADVLAGQDITKLVITPGGGGVAAPAATSAPAGPAAKKEEKAPEKKKEEPKEEPVVEEMGLGLFD